MTVIVEARSGYWQPIPGQTILSRSHGCLVTTLRVPEKGQGLAVTVVLPNGEKDVLPITDLRCVDRPRLRVVNADGTTRVPVNAKRTPRRCMTSVVQHELEFA